VIVSDWLIQRTVKAQNLSFLEVAGLAHTESQRWNLIRFQQVSELIRLFPVSATANIVNAILVAAALYSNFGYKVILWAAAVLAASGSAVVARLRRRGSGRPRPVGTGVVIRLTIQSGCLGIFWMLLPTFFFADATELQRIVMMAVIAGMMAGATLMFSTMVSAGTLYLVITGIGGLWMAVILQSPAMFVMATLYTGCLALGMISNGAAFVRAALVRAEVVDQKQTIALLLREVEESEGDWLWQTDAQHEFSRVSPRMARCLKRSESDLIGASLINLLIGDSDAPTRASALKTIERRIASRKPFVDMIIPLEMNGKSRWLKLSANPIFDESDNFCGYRGVGSDITELRRSEEKISHMARYDALTGLPNRTMVHDAITESLRRSARLSSTTALIMIDLDRFKLVNDTLGHPIGDRLLCEVADRVRNALGPGQLFGRIGGDEFAVVMGDQDSRKTAEATALKIIAAISMPYKIDDHSISIGASAGIACGVEDGASVDVLLRNADLALYHAKEKGRGNFAAFDQSMHTKAEERRTIEVDLREALERNQLELVYQPIVSVDGTTIRGFEALLRWHHPILGEIPPTKFIPIAEETGLIGAIGDWVIRNACMTARAWPNDTKVSVNLSPVQFTNSMLPSTVMGALAQSQLEPHRLELEITEGVFLLETAQTSAVLAQLKSLGVGIALDDFGTGYSSLGYLQKTTFSTIKIDRSFIHGTIVGNNENSAIIRAIVAMADSLEINTTAEGAENEADLSAVRELGCKQVQGFVFGRPMSASDALQLFDSDQYSMAA
jgi:diguanylate cyclase (GGDEF)-like protein/PAS domain S-box-containing protein